MTFEEKTLSSTRIYEGAILNLRKDEVTVRTGRSYREIIEHNGGAAIAALTDDNRIIMVKQYRKAAKKVMLEVPAGKIDRGETDAEAAMVRELKEETGYTAGSIRYLGSINPSVGYSEEVIRLYLMTDLQPGEPAWDDDEALEVELMPFDEVYRMAAEGELTDAKTIAAVFMAKHQM